MNRKAYSPQLLIRYILIQLPELAIVVLLLFLIGQWIDIPPWVSWLFILLWVGINAFMYPFVWRSYDKGDPFAMAGARGTALDRLSPSGHIRLNGEIWSARVVHGNATIEKGEPVIVTGMHGLTLLVQQCMGK